jgi:hypothetical protein
MTPLGRYTSRAGLYLLGCIVVLVNHGDAEAICAPRFVTGSPTYVYVSTFVDSLKYAKEASELTDRAVLSLAQAGDVGGYMLNVKQAGERYRCAASLLDGYLTAPNDAVKTSAESAHFVYTTLRDLDRQFLDEIRSVLDSQGRPIQTGTVLDRLSDVATKKNTAWKMLLLAAVGTTHALVVMPERQDERLSRLSVTQTERSALLREIENSFGSGVNQGLRAGVSALDGAAAALYAFLADQRWKAATNP